MASAVDITKLSREQKELLYDVLQEKKRRQRENRDVYKPNAGQILVHKSPASLRAVFAGNGSGKSALAANEAVWALQGFHPIKNELTKVPCRVIVVLDHPEKALSSWVPELNKWWNIRPEQLHKDGKHHIARISHTNGSEILFFSHSQDPLAFESIEADVIICDEPPPRPIYIALRRSLRKKGRKPWTLIVGTPISQAWMRQEILEPWQRGETPGTECFSYGTAVNEVNLAHGYIESYSAVLSEKERRIRLHGEFYDLSGLALAHLFDPQIHEVATFEWPNEYPVVVAIDPHVAKPHTAVMLGVDKDGYLFYLREYKEKALARDFARNLRKWMAGYRVIDIVMDSLGSSEYTSGEGFKSFLAVLKEEGIQARATTWEEKSDEDFIQRIQDVLAIPEQVNNFGERVPKLRVFRGNQGIVGDFQNVAWVKHKTIDENKPKLDITQKDFLSCLKYALSTNLTFNKDKARVYRRINRAETYTGRETNPMKIRFKRSRA